MTRRNGHTNRLHDFGPFTVVFFSNYLCDGSHRKPTIDVIYRQRVPNQRGPKGGIRYRKLVIPWPWVSFARAYKLRRFGALKLYRLSDRIIRRIAK